MGPDTPDTHFPPLHAIRYKVTPSSFLCFSKPGVRRGSENSSSEGAALRRGPYRRAKVSPHCSAALPAAPAAPALLLLYMWAREPVPPHPVLQDPGFQLCSPLGSEADVRRCLPRFEISASGVLFSPQSEMSESRQGRSGSPGDEEESLAVLRRWVLQRSVGCPSRRHWLYSRYKCDPPRSQPLARTVCMSMSRRGWPASTPKPASGRRAGTHTCSRRADKDTACTCAFGMSTSETRRNSGFSFLKAPFALESSGRSLVI